jgi:hypothetical protein
MQICKVEPERTSRDQTRRTPKKAGQAKLKDEPIDARTPSHQKKLAMIRAAQANHPKANRSYAMQLANDWRVAKNWLTRC